MAFLEGVKVIAMISILLSHVYLALYRLPIDNLEDYEGFAKKIWFEIAFAGFYAIDIFLFLSAFLGSYLIMEKFAKDNKYNPYDEELAGKHTHKMHIGMILFLRILRLLPSLIFLTLFVLGFIYYSGSGPVWNHFLDRNMGG